MCFSIFDISDYCQNACNNDGRSWEFGQHETVWRPSSSPSVPGVPASAWSESPGEAPDVAKMRRLQDMENLRNMLIAWNANRLDLFELSMPNEVGNFY